MGLYQKAQEMLLREVWQFCTCRFEFPQELDMYKYTVDGLAAREEADAAASSEAAASASTAPVGSGDAAAGGNATSRDGKGASMSAPLTSAPATSAAEPTTPREPPNAKQYQYTLKGIVVHSGSAFAGHYYSYIKVCLQNSALRLLALDKKI